MATNQDDKAAEAKRRRKWRAIAAGILLALICQVLPPDYRVACEVLAKLCTGGF